MTNRRRRFEAQALPHLDAAYNLARWLTRSEPDAEDIVQDAMLRAFRAFEGFRGDNFRPWLLAIVRNCWRNKVGEAARQKVTDADEAGLENFASDDASPEDAAIQSGDARRLYAVMALFPDNIRQVLILREMEDLSYQEIADMIGIPVGTVMSRLARARVMLRKKWNEGGMP